MRWVCLAVGLALSMLTVRMGFLLDDYMHLAKTDGVLLPGGTLDYFTFVRSPADVHAFVDRGPLPWWTLPELRLSFFRPLSSALISFDHTVFPHLAWVHHLHSILWFLLLIFAASTVYRRALPEGAAGLALLMFTLDDAHLMPVAWLANRNALVAGVFAVFALAAHLRWREQGWNPGRWLAPLGVAISLTGAEAALGYIGYFVAYEFFSRTGWRTRVRALAPVFVVLLGWAIMYRVNGYGAYGSATYVDPGRDPLGFLQVAGPRLMAFLGALTLKVTSDLWLLTPTVRPFLVLTGLIGTGLVVTTLALFWKEFSEEERRAVRWLGCGSVLALVPGLATFPLDRMLLASSLGALGVFAVTLRAAWRRTKKPWLVLGWLGLLNLALPPVGWVIASRFLNTYARGSERAVLDAPPDRFRGRVVLLTAADPSPAVYGLLYLRAQGRPMSERWWTLSMSPTAHRLRRVADRSLELEVIGGRMVDSVFEQLMRSEAFPMDPGYVVQLDGLKITVVEANGGHPTKIRADFDLPLAEHTLLIWTAHGFDQLQAPELGASLELPAARPLFDLGF